LSSFFLLLAAGVIIVATTGFKQALYVPPNPTGIETKVASYVPLKPTMPQVDVSVV
jgi:hypothetical protein